MVLFLFKKTGEKEYRFVGNGYLLAGILIFILTFVISIFTSGKWQFALKFASIATTGSLIYAFFSDLYGKWRHKAVIQKRLFQALISKGFEIEKYGEYCGLINTVNGTTIRIYYDWNKQKKNPLSLGDIVINILHRPFIVGYDGEEIEVDKARIDKLNDKYDSDYLGPKRLFAWNRIFVHINYFFWVKPERIEEIIKENLEIMEKERIDPLDIRKVDAEIKPLIENGWYLPPIDPVWDEFKIRTPNSEE